MELRHLRCFLALAEELHFGRAAEKVHVDQSPFSRTIKELEEELGAQLFTRNTRNTRLTLAGKAFLERVPRIFAALDQARDGVQSAANGFHGQLRVALSDCITPSRLSTLLAHCREEDPEIEVRLFEVPLSQQIKGLHDDLYDVGFSMVDAVGDGIVAIPAWQDELMVVMHSRHPLLDYRRVPLEKVLEQRLVLGDPAACLGYAQQVDRFLQKRDEELLIRQRVASFDVMMVLVSAGLAVGFAGAAHIAIDMTLAGLFWAMQHASGQGEDVIAKLLRKVLYVGAFAYIIGNFNNLAGIVFRSFAGLGLTASGSGLSQAQLLQPGRLAQVGIESGRPIMEQIGKMAGFPEVFTHLDTIVVLFLAWLVLILCFFVLAVQLFVTLLEFKLTTLAGFVLVPFALWNKTAFLAEKVLGNVVSSGIKVLVLAVIVGIGTGLFAEFRAPVGADPSIDYALVIMLASLAMLALGIFGPGIATGLVSGGPQLGAGAMAGAALGATGAAVAVGAAAAGAGSAVAAGTRMAPGAARVAGNAARSMASTADSAKSAFDAGSAAAGGGIQGAAAGVGNVAKAAGQKVAQGARSMRERAAAAFGAGAPATGDESGDGRAPQTASQERPAWASRLHRRQQIAHAATTAAHTLRGGDGGGSSQGPSLRDSDS